METVNILHPLSYVEMETTYGGLNFNAILGTVKGTASAYGGLMTGNPLIIVSGCLDIGYNIGHIFDDK